MRPWLELYVPFARRAFFCHSSRFFKVFSFPKYPVSRARYARNASDFTQFIKVGDLCEQRERERERASIKTIYFSLSRHYKYYFLQISCKRKRIFDSGWFTSDRSARAINRVASRELTRADRNVEFLAEPKIQGADRSGVDIRVRDDGRARRRGSEWRWQRDGWVGGNARRKPVGT